MYGREPRELREARYHPIACSSSLEPGLPCTQKYSQGFYDDGFYEFFDTQETFRPARRRSEYERLGRDEVIDLRKPARDLPSPGQIIWDDIGDSDLVESLSWSQSDVEREIESWDQRLRESENLCRRSAAWDDGDMIQFEDGEDVYLPRRASSVGHKFQQARRSSKENRRRKEQDRRSLYKYRHKENASNSGQLLIPKRSASVGRTARTPQDHAHPKTEIKAGAAEAVSKPRKPTAEAETQVADDCACPCEISYSSYKRVSLVTSLNSTHAILFSIAINFSKA